MAGVHFVADDVVVTEHLPYPPRWRRQVCRSASSRPDLGPGKAAIVLGVTAAAIFFSWRPWCGFSVRQRCR